MLFFNHKTYIKTKIKTLMIDNKFITLDVETMVVDGEHIPYCVCLYDGKNNFSYYLTEFSDHFEMLEAVVNNLLRQKYTGYVVYVHNLSRFDGIFLFLIIRYIIIIFFIFRLIS